MARVCLEEATGLNPANGGCPEAVVDLLASYTEGLPFLVEELLAAWIRSGALVDGPGGWETVRELSPVAPLTFADTVSRRLGSLGSETRRLLEVAAVLGRHFDWTLLPEAIGLDEQDVLERLRGAIDAQLVMADHTEAPLVGGLPGPQATFGFRHALTRQAVLAELLPPERAALSDRMLSLVEGAHAGLPGEWCELAARLAESAEKKDRAAQLLHESGRRALSRGALATAESTLERARDLAPGDQTLLIEIEDTLTEVLSLAGKWERVFEVGERLLAALQTASAPLDRRAEVYLRTARAALAAGHRDEAADHLDQARQLAGRRGPVGSLPDPASRSQAADLLARLDALAAHLAIEQTQLDKAAAFARSALEEAERAGLPDVACEALEALGRCARVTDLEQAEAAFERARAVATENGLTVWRIRALHELGTLDIFRGARLERLLEARDLAVNAGALATAAMVDVQIAACLDQRPEPEATLEVARRSETMARRFRLDLTAAVALVFQAVAHAKLGKRAEMEAAIAESLQLAASEPMIVAFMWESRAIASVVEDKWKQALDELDRAVAAVAGMPATAPGPFYGFWALIRSAEDIDGPAACDTVRRAGATVNPINRAYVGYAEAITLGRSGWGEEAAAAVSRADADLAGMDWYRHCGHRVVAEAAARDGWGEPASWLWEASAHFESASQEKLASACRSLLRRMGVPGTQTSRTHRGVPAPFRSLGITRREMEVLAVLAEGLSNKEIGERLFLSPRTVEKHVASLMAKTETRTRSQLAALAISAAAQS